MTLELSLNFTQKLLAASLFFQGIEYFLISKKADFNNVWSFENFKEELGHFSVFKNSFFPGIAFLQALLAVLFFVLPHSGLLVGLWLTHLYFCVRFRGTFNGGSDMMIFVVITGLLISLSATDLFWQKMGVVYITIHCLYSYFKAGIVKMKSMDWLSGKALPHFLKESLLKDFRSVSLWLEKHPKTSKILSLGIIFFELSALLLLFFPQLVLPYFAIAMSFHFAIFIGFGLNRFFWAWISAWPAVIYCILRIIHAT